MSRPVCLGDLTMRLALPFALLSFLVLAACDSGSPTQPAQNSSVVDADAPLGQLPDTIRPLRYRLDLTIRPDQPRYSGVVAIYGEVKGLPKRIYLHGHELKVT